MNKWPMVALGELIEQAKVSRAGNSEFPLLSMTMHNGLVLQSARFGKRIASRDTSTYKVVKQGQLVVGFPIDEGVLDFQDVCDEGIVSPAYQVWDIRAPEMVDANYLGKYLKSEQALNYYSSKLRGSTARRRSLPQSVFLEMGVPLPPINEQRRITTILEMAERLRSSRLRTLTFYRALSQSKFMELFGRDNFPRIPAGKLMPAMRNGVSPSKAGAFPAKVLTLTSITQGRFDEDQHKFGLFDTDPPQTKRVASLDFLMCRGNGNRSLVGAGVLPSTDRPDLVFPDTIIAGSIDRDVVNPTYLEASWKQMNVRTQIASASRTTSGIHKVNQQSLSSVLVPLPPMELQDLFASVSREIDLKMSAVHASLRNLGEVDSALQSRAFRGEL